MKVHQLAAPELGPGRPNLVLVGFSATGKSSGGGLAAALLGMPLVDLDQVAEARSGLTLSELFQEHGEAHFRGLESRLLLEAARLSGTVVATGGGAVLHGPELAELSRGALVVSLSASEQEIERRLGGAAPRPLLAGARGPRIGQLLAERATAYSSVGEPLETTGLSLDAVAEQLARRHRQRSPEGPATVQVSGPSGSYPVVVGTGALRRLPELVRERLPGVGRLVLVSDLAVADSAGERVAGLLRSEGLEVEAVAMERGEASKRLEAVARLWDRFQELRIDRGDAVLAVGGGAALDAAGFAAATWARGLPLVNIPTTVLAMADAAIGGKVAIDRVGAKNAVGAFHHPRLVVADPELLSTLAPEVARDGLAEVVKCAVLASPLLLGLMEEMEPDLDPRRLAWLIEQAARIKAAYVAADPEDQGLRQALNLGHTYAHGLEAASGYRVPHGRAVAAGLVAAAGLGERLGLCQPGLGSRLQALLNRLGLGWPLPRLDHDQVLSATLSDKKRRGGRSVLVIPTPAGAALVEGLDPELALAPLWELLPARAGLGSGVGTRGGRW